MGILYMSASSLGFVVEYVVLQNDPQYSDGQVVQIEPPPGTAALRGSTVRVTINLAG
jgi:beta-lactam-binding protein with PASTA domain